MVKEEKREPKAFSPSILAQSDTEGQVWSVERFNNRPQTEAEWMELVRRYYELGLTVVPLKPREKCPTCQWQEFRHRKPTWQETERLFHEALATYGTDINIATITGKVHGFVVVDVDDMEAFANLKDIAPVLTYLAIWTVNTRRGMHLYFRHPSDVEFASARLQPKDESLRKVELMAEGHIVVLPPSVHPEGGIYRFNERQNPVTYPPNSVVELPSELVNLFTVAKDIKPFEGIDDEELEDFSTVPEWLERLVEMVTPHWNEGSRHNLSLAIVGLFRKRCLPSRLAKAFVALVTKATGDEEVKDRLRVVEDTYRKSTTEVAGFQLLSQIVGERLAAEIANLLPSEPEERRKLLTVELQDTDDGNALLVATYHGDRIVFVEGDCFYVYEGGRFYRDRRGWRVKSLITDAIKREIKKVDKDTTMDASVKEKRLKWLKNSLNEHRVEKCMSALERVVTKVYPDGLDADHHLLNVRNGVLNLVTKELLPHSPSFLMTHRANAEYNPDADCPMFKAFLREITDGDEDYIRDLQLIFGYAATGDVSQDAIFFLYGRGANGKTTLLNIISDVLGSYAKVVSTEIFLPYSRRSHDEVLADLLRLRMAVITEWKEDEPLSSHSLKMLASQTPISARRLYGERFTFMPTHKVFVSTNLLPKIEDKTEGGRRRIFILPFTVYIPPEKRDRQLAQKILATERSGILNWILEGAARYFELGRLVFTSQFVREINEEYDEDLVDMWIAERCVKDGRAMTPFSELYEDYVATMRKWNVPAEEILKKNAFSEALSQRGFPTVRKTAMRYKRGLRLRTEGEPTSPQNEPSTTDTTPSDVTTTEVTKPTDTPPSERRDTPTGLLTNGNNNVEAGVEGVTVADTLVVCVGCGQLATCDAETGYFVCHDCNEFYTPNGEPLGEWLGDGWQFEASMKCRHCHIALLKRGDRLQCPNCGSEYTVNTEGKISELVSTVEVLSDLFANTETEGDGSGKTDGKERMPVATDRPSEGSEAVMQCPECGNTKIQPLYDTGYYQCTVCAAILTVRGEKLPIGKGWIITNVAWRWCLDCRSAVLFNEVTKELKCFNCGRQYTEEELKEHFVCVGCGKKPQLREDIGYYLCYDCRKVYDLKGHCISDTVKRNGYRFDKQLRCLNCNTVLVAIHDRYRWCPNCGNHYEVCEDGSLEELTPLQVDLLFW